MCTATWWRSPGGYELFFNRDELNSRQRAEPPARIQIGGMPVITPRDPDGGGTWLLVNGAGLTVALVNHFPQPKQPVPEAPVSRGQLVLELGNCGSAPEVGSRLEKQTMRNYRPFFLLALSTDQPACLWTWDGHTLDCLRHADQVQPVTSSSVETEAVIRHRRTLYRDLEDRTSSDRLAEYHARHEPTEGAYGVCMIRPDAETVSHARVGVTPETVSMVYSEKERGHPSFLPETTVSIPRSVASANVG